MRLKDFGVEYIPCMWQLSCMLTGQALRMRRGDAGMAVAIRDVDFSPAHSDKVRPLLDMQATATISFDGLHSCQVSCCLTLPL